MALFRQVQTSFWQDPKVLEELTPEDKYFYLYLLTNPNTKQIGIYQITKKQMAFDLGYSIETINQLMDRFEKHHNFIKYNPHTREIILLNWSKYNFKRGGKPIEDCIVKEISEVKYTEFLLIMASKITNEKIKQLFLDSLHDTGNDTLTTGEQEKEEEKEEKEKEYKNNSNNENSTHSDNEYDSILFYEKNFGMINSYIAQEIEHWSTDLNEEVVIEAMKRALEQQKKWSYAKRILFNWVNKNVKTLNDVQALDVEFENRKKSRTAQNFNSHIRQEIVPDWLQEQNTYLPKDSKKVEIARKKLEQELLMFQRKKEVNM